MRATQALSVLALCATLSAQGCFQPDPADIEATKWVTSSVVVADFNGDGLPDLVTGAFPANNPNLVVLNDGRGGWIRKSSNGLSSYGTAKIIPGDLDGDGDEDLILFQANYMSPNVTCHAWFNDGTASFQGGSAINGRGTGGVLADLDGDGDLDLVCAEQVSWDSSGYHRYFGSPSVLWNDSKGGFTRMPLYAGSEFVSTVCARVADLDGDGDLDLVFGAERYRKTTSSPPNDYQVVSDEAFVFLNQGRQTFTDLSGKSGLPKTGVMSELALLDMDGDQAVDIVAITTSGQGSRLRFFGNSGKAVFTEDQTKLLGSTVLPQVEELFPVDLGEDGVMDLFVGRPAPSMLLRNDGKARLTVLPASTWAPPPSLTQGWTVVGTADVDLDADTDLLIVEYAASWVGQSPLRWSRNLERQLLAPSPPTLGKPWPLVLAAQPGRSAQPRAGVVWLAAGPIAKPTPVPPFGQWMLAWPWVQLEPALYLAVPQGIAAHAVPVPNQTGLLGLHLTAQGLVVDGGGSARLTNALPAVVTK